MIIFPDIDPVALYLGPLKLHWYGLMYMIGICGAWFLLWKFRFDRLNGKLTNESLSDLVFYASMGVVLGGRVGFVFFYNLRGFIADPVVLFKIWEGGMSFHGGLLGVLVAIWLFCRKYKLAFFQTMDYIAPVIPIGLGAGRIGNFINAELWGKPTDLPWGVLFPYFSDPLELPRHPSQLYQFFLEGVVLFTILWLFSRKERPVMATSALFTICYGVFRFLVEFVRMPDAHLGYIAFGWLTMGQILCIPMIIVGLFVFYISYKPKSATQS